MVYGCSNKDIILIGSYEFDWLSTMIGREFKLKRLDFVFKRKYNKKKGALGLLVRHGDKSFTKQTLNLELYVGPIF